MSGSENIWMRHWREVNADDEPPLSAKAGERGGRKCEICNREKHGRNGYMWVPPSVTPTGFTNNRYNNPKLTVEYYN